jgi:FkbM family methyltransferase
VPELYRECVAERPDARVVRCALVAEERPGATVRMRYGGLMSVVEGTHGTPEDDRAWVAPAFALGLEDEYELEVPARTLSSLLDEMDAPEVDLLSLDVEGHEVEALRGLDLERHAPRFVLVEIHDMQTGQPPIDALLGERYVAVEQLSPVDLLYARRDQPAAQAASTRS